MPQAPQTRLAVIRFGDFELDVRAGELRKGDRTIRRQEQCLQILTMLLAHPGEVVTREELRARLWPHSTIVDFEHSVNAAMKRLREALGDSADNPKFVETIPRRGYRFLMPVQDPATDRDNEAAKAPQKPESAQPISEPLPERFDHYDVIGKIGAGATGVVYRAHDRRLDRDVAVKVLLSLFASDPKALRRFQHEARVTLALNHPNIVTVYDVGEAEGAPYIVSELLEGKTLRECLAAERLSQETAIDYAVQILSGLAAAHEAGIIHRDLKPENIFITQSGVKILDFGLAKLKALEAHGPEALTVSSLGWTMPGAILGTAGYMAPEQVRGEPADQRSDIFGFGTTFYEMLTGKRAFRGKTPVDTLSAILNTEPEELQQGHSSLSGPLAAVLRRCLEKAPENRYQTAKEIIVGVKQIDSGTGPRPRRRQRGWRQRFVVALGALALLVAVSVVLIFRQFFPHATTRMSDSEENAVLQTITQSYKDAFESMVIDDVAKVWPTISKRQREGMDETFKIFKAIKVSYSCEKPVIKGDAAQCDCRETVTYTTPDNKRQGPVAGSIIFQLKKARDGWVVWDRRGK